MQPAVLLCFVIVLDLSFGYVVPKGPPMYPKTHKKGGSHVYEPPKRPVSYESHGYPPKKEYYKDDVKYDYPKDSYDREPDPIIREPASSESKSSSSSESKSCEKPEPCICPTTKEPPVCPSSSTPPQCPTHETLEPYTCVPCANVTQSTCPPVDYTPGPDCVCTTVETRGQPEPFSCPSLSPELPACTSSAPEPCDCQSLPPGESCSTLNPVLECPSMAPCPTLGVLDVTCHQVEITTSECPLCSCSTLPYPFRTSAVPCQETTSECSCPSVEPLVCPTPEPCVAINTLKPELPENCPTVSCEFSTPEATECNCPSMIPIFWSTSECPSLPSLEPVSCPSIESITSTECPSCSCPSITFPFMTTLIPQESSTSECVCPSVDPVVICPSTPSFLALTTAEPIICSSIACPELSTLEPGQTCSCPTLDPGMVTFSAYPEYSTAQAITCPQIEPTTLIECPTCSCPSITLSWMTTPLESTPADCLCPSPDPSIICPSTEASVPASTEEPVVCSSMACPEVLNPEAITCSCPTVDPTMATFSACPEYSTSEVVTCPQIEAITSSECPSCSECPQITFPTPLPWELSTSECSCSTPDPAVFCPSTEACLAPSTIEPIFYSSQACPELPTIEDGETCSCPTIDPRMVTFSPCPEYSTPDVVTCPQIDATTPSECPACSCPSITLPWITPPSESTSSDCICSTPDPSIICPSTEACPAVSTMEPVVCSSMACPEVSTPEAMTCSCPTVDPLMATFSACPEYSTPEVVTCPQIEAITSSECPSCSECPQITFPTPFQWELSTSECSCSTPDPAVFCPSTEACLVLPTMEQIVCPSTAACPEPSTDDARECSCPPMDPRLFTFSPCPEASSLEPVTCHQADSTPSECPICVCSTEACSLMTTPAPGDLTTAECICPTLGSCPEASSFEPISCPSTEACPTMASPENWLFSTISCPACEACSTVLPEETITMSCPSFSTLPPEPCSTEACNCPSSGFFFPWTSSECPTPTPITCPEPSSALPCPELASFEPVTCPDITCPMATTPMGLEAMTASCPVCEACTTILPDDWSTRSCPILETEAPVACSTESCNCPSTEAIIWTSSECPSYSTPEPIVCPSTQACPEPSSVEPITCSSPEPEPCLCPSTEAIFWTTSECPSVPTPDVLQCSTRECVCESPEPVICSTSLPEDLVTISCPACVTEACPLQSTVPAIECTPSACDCSTVLPPFWTTSPCPTYTPAEPFECTTMACECSTAFPLDVTTQSCPVCTTQACPEATTPIPLEPQTISCPVCELCTTPLPWEPTTISCEGFTTPEAVTCPEITCPEPTTIEPVQCTPSECICTSVQPEVCSTAAPDEQTTQKCPECECTSFACPIPTTPEPVICTTESCPICVTEPPVECTTNYCEPYTTMNPQTCDIKGLDLAFVMDVSGSIEPTNFLTMQQALMNIVQKIPVGNGDDEVQIGFYTFNETTQYRWGLSEYLTVAEQQTAIASLDYVGGGTCIACGIGNATQKIFVDPRPGNTNRADKPDVMIVITDGKDDDIDALISARDKARAANITMYAVGIGKESEISRDQLKIIAGESDRVHTGSFKFLEKILLDICGSLEQPSHVGSAARPLQAPKAPKAPTAPAAPLAVTPPPYSCDYEDIHSKVPDFTILEFCAIRPWCTKYC